MLLLFVYYGTGDGLCGGVDLTVLPPTCNCDGIKTIDTPCPIHGGAHRLRERLMKPTDFKPDVGRLKWHYEKKVGELIGKN